jgi:hypothetical protein
VTVPGTHPPPEYWGKCLAKVVEGLFVLLGGHQDNRAHSNLLRILALLADVRCP